MYVMHALGAGDGSMILQAAINGDTRLAANLVSSEVVTSYPTWFGGNPTPQGLVDHLSGLVGARVTDQSTFTTTGDRIPPKQVTMSEAGKRLAEAFEKKNPTLKEINYYVSLTKDAKELGLLSVTDQAYFREHDVEIRNNLNFWKSEVDKLERLLKGESNDIES